MEAIPAKVSDYMAQLVKIQRAIAAADAPLLPCLTDKLKHAICEGIQDKEQRISLCAALDSLPGGQATCHGALMPQDIIMNQNGGYCILNWANAARGNSLFDAADTFVQLTLEDNEQLALSQLYLSTFSASDPPLERAVLRFVPICAAARIGGANERERSILNGLINQ